MGNRTCQPSVGDMVEFNRIFYSHFGIYVGGGYVIHLSGDKWSGSGRSGGMPVVKKDLLKDVAGLFNYKVKNTRDHERKADSPQTISDRAHLYIGYSEYDLVRFNCETFASMCRYGRGRSKQTDKYISNVRSVTHSVVSVKRQRRQRSTQHEVQTDTIYEDFYDAEDDEDDE